MDLVTKCVVALERAKSDTEIFAAVLLLSKCLKNDVVTRSLKAELFEVIGTNFLHRLLHTAVVPNECPAHVFKSVALSIMAAFCSDAKCDSAVVKFVLEELPMLKDILQRTLIEDEVVDDVLCCLNSAALDVAGQMCLIEAGILDGLIDRCLLGNHCHGECLSLLLNLLQSHPKECWAISSDFLIRLLHVQCSAFKNDLSIHKFQLASHLVVLLNSFPENVELDQDCISDLHEGIYGVLTSKIFKEYCKPILMLTCLLFVKFLPITIRTLHTCKKIDTFLPVLLHMVSIEVRMILDETPILDVARENVTLIACYSILERILTVSSELWEMIQEHIEKVLTALKLAFGSIINFLNSLALEWDNLVLSNNGNCLEVREVGFATVRVLCSWMSEESVTLRKEICSVLPFVLKVVSKNDEFVNEDQTSSNLMHCLLPALCHLSADDYYHEIMLTENIPETLLNYIHDTWEKCEDEEIFHSILTTACSIFLNMVVMGGCNIAQDKTYFELLQFLMLKLPRVRSRTDSKHLELEANFSVLGLLIARRFFGRLKSCELEFHKFLKASILFLWNTHEVFSAGQKTKMALSNEYLQAWPNIMEYWFLGMQALCSLMLLLPWIAVFVIESDWPNYVISSLEKVSVGEVEDSVKSAYQEILCSLVKSDPFAADLLIQCGAIQVSNIHNMKELQQVLSLS